MITYAKDELVSASKLGRKLGSILKRLREKKIKKVGVLRNNNLEAALIPIEEYERLLEIVEHIETAKQIEEREKTDLKEAVSMEDLAKENGIDIDEL